MADKVRDDVTPASVAGQSVLPDDIRESIALGSFCSITGQPSSLSNLAYSNAISNNNLTQQNTVANQQAMNEVAQSVLGNAVNLVANLNPMEAVAVTKMDTGNDIAQQIMDLQAAIAGGPSPQVQPLKPPPLNLKPNPAGGAFITATLDQFPIKLVLGNSGAPPKSPNTKSGTQLNVKERHFPLEIRLQGKPTKPIGTIADVSPFRFPFTVNIDGGSGLPIKEESPLGPSSLMVAEGKFPLRINLTPP